MITDGFFGFLYILALNWIRSMFGISLKLEENFRVAALDTTTDHCPCFDRRRKMNRFRAGSPGYIISPYAATDKIRWYVLI
jgi:hypothetical protein